MVGSGELRLDASPFCHRHCGEAGLPEVFVQLNDWQAGQIS
jgi:hypothetical protein